MTPPLNKEQTAGQLLAHCIGTHGVWAGNRRYARQNWTRDFAFATMPYLLAHGGEDAARRHLANLSRGVRPNGQVPILFLDGPAAHARFVADKVLKSVRDGKPSFMLRRYLRGQLWNLTPGTRDSEILYLFAMANLAARDADVVDQFDLEIGRVTGYVRRKIMVEGWLATGADWRDTMHEELRHKTLLTNNALLYAALTRLGNRAFAYQVRMNLRQTHFLEDRILDYPGSDRFDPLGGAFAVLHGVAEPGDYPLLTRMFRSVDRPCGVTIKCRHNPISDREAEVIEETDGVVTWPFVVGFTVLALIKMGEVDFAREQFKKLKAHDGFREYYHPDTGEGFGEEQQLWSAVLYLRALDAIRSL